MLQKKEGKKRANVPKTFPQGFYEDFLVVLKGPILRILTEIGPAYKGKLENHACELLLTKARKWLFSGLSFLARCGV